MNFNHLNLQDALSCDKCNPRGLTEREFVACLANEIDPRKLTKEQTTAWSKLVAAGAEAAGKEK
jgi:hypothetical protein